MRKSDLAWREGITFRSLALGTLIRRVLPVSRSLSDRMGVTASQIEATYPHTLFDGMPFATALLREFQSY